MYFLSILGVIVLSGFLLALGNADATWYLDVPSLLLIVLFDVTMLLGAGLLKDFNRAFRLIVSTKEESADLLRRSIEAVCLARRVTITAGVFTLVAQLILILGRLDEPSKLGPSLAVGMLTLLYASAVTLILLPLESGLKLKLQKLLHE